MSLKTASVDSEATTNVPSKLQKIINMVIIGSKFAILKIGFLETKAILFFHKKNMSG